jgi:hypothetical protein
MKKTKDITTVNLELTKKDIAWIKYSLIRTVARFDEEGKSKLTPKEQKELWDLINRIDKITISK